jgi:hypothetical protein
MADLYDLLQQPQQQTVKKGFQLSDLLPAAGGIVGGIGGTILGGPIGGVAGATLLAGAGEATRQKSQGEGLNIKKIGTESLISGAGELAGLGLAKAGGKVLGSVGSGLTKTGENVALRGTRLNSGQLTKFASQHGEDVAQLLQRYGGQITDESIIPVQESFNQIAKKSGIKISKNEISDIFIKTINDLKKSSPSYNKNLAIKLEGELNNVLSGIKGKTADIGDIYKQVQSYDSLVKNFASDPVVAGENRLTANLLRESVQKAANNAGLKTSTGTLKETGLELSKLYDAQKLIAKQSNLGRGSLPLGLTKLLAATAGGVGGVVGGFPGAAAGVALTETINNPKVLNAASKLLTRSGESIASKATSPTFRVGSELIGQLGAQGIKSSNQLNQTQGNEIDLNSLLNPYGSNSQSSQIKNQQVQLSNQDLAQLMILDLAETGGKNLSAIQAIGKLLQPSETTTKKTEAQVAREDTLSLAQTALDTILNNQNIKTGLINKPITELKSKVGLADQDTLSFNTQLAMLKAGIAKARAGTSFTPNEEKLLNQYSPTPGDSRQQIITKLNNLVQFFASRPDAGTDNVANLLNQYSQ